MLEMVYWYYLPGQQVYPEGLKFTAHHDIRKALYWFVYPLVLIEEDLNWTGVYTVYRTDPPEAPEGKIAIDGTPALIDGLWMRQWDIVDAPPSEPEPEPEPPADPPPAEPDPAPADPADEPTS